MDKLKLLVILFFIVTSVSAQSGLLGRANRLFEKKSYVEAAAVYEKLGDDEMVLQNLGDSYFFNSKMSSAAKAYKRLFAKTPDSIPNEIYFRYAQALMGTGDYSTADSLMTIYTNNSVNTKNFKKVVEEESPFIHEIKRLNKSGASDFGISFYGDKIVFASSRNTTSPTYDWNAEPYLDLFTATVTEDGDLENVKAFSQKINTRTHESNAVFTKDGKTMYFSRTNDTRVKIGKVKVASVKIYSAEFVDSVWTNVKELPFNSDYYSCQHPALSDDESILYFSSDMPGTLGSFDLYAVDVNDQSFDLPVNLGGTINTIHREQFPFIDADTLYFSSDGHQGLGGLDVFMSTQLDVEGIQNENTEIQTKTAEDIHFSEPFNLGEPINTGLDDFNYVVSKEEKGFLSSNRIGDDNLYSFIRIENTRNTIFGKVVDKTTQEIIPDARVILYDEDDNVIEEKSVDENGEFEFSTEADMTYKVEGLKDLYIPALEQVTTNQYGTIENEIVLELETYDEAEEIVVERDGSNYIELENIYFDLDKWAILPAAANTLNILIDLLNKYPRMEVELGAHTDSRATESYNLYLSENRARSAMQYLIAKGIDKSRLSSRGYGELVPLVDCGDDCSELEHSINRRVEFLIVR